MIIKYQGYWATRKTLQPEISSVSLWDTWNNTSNEKKIENGDSTSSDIAKENHNNNLGYEFSAFEDKDTEFPFCSVDILPANKHIGIEFIDGSGRKYLTY